MILILFIKQPYKLSPNRLIGYLKEIQNSEHWDLFVNRLQRKGLNIIVTGSNGKILSREISTHLTGRSISIELFPFSFREFLEYFKVSYSKHYTIETEAIIKKNFLIWMRAGGFPETFELNINRSYLQELYDRIITRDVLQRLKHLSNIYIVFDFF